jgi:hypothetical protein
MGRGDISQLDYNIILELCCKHEDIKNGQRTKRYTGKNEKKCWKWSHERINWEHVRRLHDRHTYFLEIPTGYTTNEEKGGDKKSFVYLLPKM